MIEKGPFDGILTQANAVVPKGCFSIQGNRVTDHAGCTVLINSSGLGRNNNAVALRPACRNSANAFMPPINWLFWMEKTDAERIASVRL